MSTRWMAIESITEGIFNEKSDVWSFGLVMLEMFSLGRDPYPRIPENELTIQTISSEIEKMVNDHSRKPPFATQHM